MPSAAWHLLSQAARGGTAESHRALLPLEGTPGPVTLFSKKEKILYVFRYCTEGELYYISLLHPFLNLILGTLIFLLLFGFLLCFQPEVQFLPPVARALNVATETAQWMKPQGREACHESGSRHPSLTAYKTPYAITEVVG